MDVVGAIEAGGTKFVCGIATADGELHARARFPTTTADENYAQAVAFLRSEADRIGKLRGIGIAHFGPLNVDPDSSEYGVLLNTPKEGWSGVRVPAEIGNHTDAPIAIDTDVNCAALAEARWGAGKGLDDIVYITIGTGIGAGILIGGKLAYGTAHPEVGHMLLPREPCDSDFEGSCPFHGGRCAEGLAAGPAIRARFGADPADLAADHPAWDLEATYIATLCLNLTVTISPAKIVLGGGVMQRDFLYPMIRERFAALINGYSDPSRWSSGNDGFIVAPGLGADAGLLGAAAIAPGFDTLPAS